MKTNITACTLATGLWLLAAPSAPAFFDATIGRWASRDPIEENGGLNLYSTLENALMDRVDPLGQEHFRIWASAFIPAATLRFPYPRGLDRSARWYGDNRKGAQEGGSSRAYHLIIVETDPALVPEILNLPGGGITRVDYYFGNWSTLPKPTLGDFWKPFTDVALDATPPRATITRSSDGHLTTVTFSADTSDPLVPLLAPALHYDYTLVFDVCKGTLTITGSHGAFPGFDLIVKQAVHVNYIPTGINKQPGALLFPRRPVGAILKTMQTYP